MTTTNKLDIYNAKPPVFDGEKFDYWKDRIESFFLGYDADLWDMVIIGYEPPVYTPGVVIIMNKMSDDQKRDFKNHHKARTIQLNTISYNEYEKITNRDINKEIFDSLKMTHEGNNQVKETKTLALIQKYEAFRMEDDGAVEKLRQKFKALKRVHEETIEECDKLKIEVSELKGSDEKSKESEDAERETPKVTEISTSQKRSRNRLNVYEELTLGNKDEPVKTREVGERLKARLAREAEERARGKAEEKDKFEAEEKARRETAEKAAAESAAAVEAEAKAKADVEEATHIAAEEAAKEKDVALTQGESSHFEFAPLVLKTLEELHKE
ncbi:eukaryotic translation initiation factor 4 gamma-like [Lathyrus oleraceus]|uniref:eukaryotic translation initiation factor 4 gamma-like n=1 Tax=Pisum sativum TaxID=3888 RepID=UPI0021D3152B|nr:eukaryotic translation initiation factor 4 gamma-like [Pisum sativum]